jgi:hypothetical protein
LLLRLNQRLVNQPLVNQPLVNQPPVVPVLRLRGKQES